MVGSEQPAWRRWVYAAKPASWPKLLVPSLLGQGLGVAATGRLDAAALLLGLLFSVFDLLFIVYLNDWGDRDVDRIKRRLFPDGCSPKTIPDGILPAHQLLFAGLLAGGLALTTAFVGATLLPRPGLGLAAALCLGIFVAYTLPPVRLNYRGGGELLEMVGVGVALPLLHAFLQAGRLDDPRLLQVLPGFALLSLASAIASGLSDEVSDRKGGKRTFATLLGNRLARAGCELSAGFGIVAWMVAASLAPVPTSWPLMVGAVVATYHLREVRRASDDAVTNAFRAQARYKLHLHRAIWRGGAAIAASAILDAAIS